MTDPQSEGVTLPTLVMTGGPLDGTTYPLTVTAKELVLGSSMDADVQIMLGNVEPTHASLSLGSGGLAIADGGSATGTFVNGEKVEGAQTLQEGDRICLGPPGAKGSAKLLVRLPGGIAPPAAEGEAPAMPASDVSASDSPFGSEAAPLVIDDSDNAPLLLDGDSPAPPQPAFVPEPEAAPPAEQPDLTGEEILAAEEVVVADEAAPPLEATEVLPEGGDGALFDSPLPPPPAVAPPTIPFAPEQPPAAPEPPPEAPEAPLTAPPPEDYQTELPSIPVDIPEEPASPLEPEPGPRPPAPRMQAPARARRTGRRPRRSSVPIVPIAGGAVALLAIGAAGWWFFLRPKPSPTPPPPAPGAAAPAPAAAAPAGTPQVSALEPDVALPGQAILIRGENLSAPVSVTVGGSPAEVAESTEQTIRVVVPDLSLTEGQKTDLVVSAGGTALAPVELFIGRSPLVLALEPARGAAGERVVIQGRGFDPSPGGNTVTFGGTPGLVLTASPSELAVVAPVASTTESPEVPVIVTAGGQASSGNVRYFVTRSTTSTFAPRFFASPVEKYPGEPLAFVSTQLAPVLLLGGPDRSESTAVRAADLSATLNRLAQAARSKKIEIEYRPRPDPSVAVVGEVDPFLTATAADAAAYSKPWESGARSGRRARASALAQHWAALLQDYFGLFLYKERPLQMLSLSPRGQVFMDIYSAARRRSSGRGVATSVVYPTSETMANALSQAALVVSGGSPREEVAVEGRWAGHLNDPDTGTRRFEVRLDLTSQGLDGDMKTWRGSIELGSPLRAISFKRGTVRFTVDLQGTPHVFEGVLEGENITGAATREGRSPAPFTLQYSE